MTDAEITKALECHADIDIATCKVCAYDGVLRCGHQLCHDALDLISRQKAEIERLEAEIDKQYEQARADILGNMSDGGASCHWCISQHKSEAIKEFTERLEDEAYGNDLYDRSGCPVKAVTIADVENVKKRNGR